MDDAAANAAIAETRGTYRASARDDLLALMMAGQTTKGMKGMEFVKKGRVPSARYFYARTVTNCSTGESYEDFRVTCDCVIMTQEEYERMVKNDCR